MKAKELRTLYLEFFKKHGHAVIPSAPLIPENDPTVLFTTAGMHPLVPYLLGQKHPEGTRLTDYQKCIRTGDIDCVGDDTHLTFFEMLGNWSLGDYFKKEAIAFSYEFLTSSEWLGLNPDKLSVTVFQGDDDAPADNEAASFWVNAGIPKERIFYLPKKDNWWGPAGMTGPCGPDTEMFVDCGKPACSDSCQPGCSCGKYVEIWNDVFMQYNKTAEGTYEPLVQKNVDTGMGLERTITMLQGKQSVYETELFTPILQAISGLSSTMPTQSSRIIADHIKASVFMMSDGVLPSNLGQGYVLRRLIRRVIRHGKIHGIENFFTHQIADAVIDTMKEPWITLDAKRSEIIATFETEEKQFDKTLSHGLKEFNKMIEKMEKAPVKVISGRVAFKLYDTYGFPVEFTQELAQEKGFSIDMKGFDEQFQKHQELSRKGAEKIFKGGLADHSEMTTKLHTATHLLHQSLRNILGEHVYQKGSNITAERLRFDFSHPDKIDPDILKQIETMVNEQIQKNLPVTCSEMTVEEAKNAGAIGLFESKYGERVKVYSVGDFSKEMCGGPHVETTGELGTFKILKEQSSSQGVRRIKAVLE